jgi:hypothetical protein
LDSGLDAGLDSGAPPDAGTFPPGWWDTGFKTRWRIDLGTPGETLNNFPVLIKLTNANVDYQKIATGGTDIRFTDAAGNEIVHETEAFTENGDSFIWVKVPTIANGDANAHLFMYANHSAPPAALVGNVWTDGFRGVWHLSGDATDSSPQGHDGTPSGGVWAAGVSGQGIVMDGDDTIDLGTDTTMLPSTSKATISAFIRLDAAGVNTARDIFSLSVDNNAYASPTASRLAMVIDSANLLVAGGRSTDAAASGFPNSNITLNADTDLWLVAVVHFDNDAVDFYVNGSFIITVATSYLNNSTPSTPSTYAALGTQDDGASNFFQGLMDEVRLANTGRSAAWIQSQYQSVTGVFSQVGTEETPIP